MCTRLPKAKWRKMIRMVEEGATNERTLEPKTKSCAKRSTKRKNKPQRLKLKGSRFRMMSGFKETSNSTLSGKSKA